MPLFTLDTVQLRLLRLKYRVAVCLLPLGLTFLSFVPLMSFASWLEGVFGISPGSPIPQHPNGNSWFIAFLVSMCGFMIVGYVLGWLANYAIARTVLGWSAQRVRATFFGPEVPKHWLSNPTASRD
jgi:hypothetical protein